MLKNLTMLDQVAKSNITKWSIQGHMMFKLVWCSTIPVFLKWKLQFVTPLWVFSISEQEWQWSVKETQFLVLFLTQDTEQWTHLLRYVHKKNAVWVILCPAFGFLLSQLLFFLISRLLPEKAASRSPKETRKSFWYSCQLHASTAPSGFLVV